VIINNVKILLDASFGYGFVTRNRKKISEGEEEQKPIIDISHDPDKLD
jgi:hypothetical protein